MLSLRVRGTKDRRLGCRLTRRARLLPCKPLMQLSSSKRSCRVAEELDKRRGCLATRLMV